MSEWWKDVWNIISKFDVNQVDDIVTKLSGEELELSEIDEFNDLCIAMRGENAPVTEVYRMSVMDILDLEPDERRDLYRASAGHVKVVCVVTDTISSPHLLTITSINDLLSECCGLEEEEALIMELWFYEVDYTRCDITKLETEFDLDAPASWDADNFVPFGLSIARKYQLKWAIPYLKKVTEVKPGGKYVQIEDDDGITTGDIDFERNDPVYEISEEGLSKYIWPKCEITESCSQFVDCP